MKNTFVILFLISLIWVSCDKAPLEKPENLISKKKMVEMLVDVHIAEATFQNLRGRDTLVRNSSSANFYYSILEKHQVADSVFEKSFVYYAAFPKEFEKIYRDVTNILNEMEQDFSGRKNDILEFDTEE